MCVFSRSAAAAKSLQLCPTLCDRRDGSPPGSAVPGILQARTPEWVAISFSNAWKWKVKGKSLSRARLLATPWTAAYQAPPSMGLSRQEYWSGVPLPSPVQSLNHVQLFLTPRTVDHQAPLSMGFPRQEHWSGLPFRESSRHRDWTLVSYTAGGFFTVWATREALVQSKETYNNKGRKCIFPLYF